LERAYLTLDSLLPKLGPEDLATPRRFSGRGWTVVVPRLVMRHVINHVPHHRGQIASKRKRFGVQQSETDLTFWAMEQVPQPSVRE
jgi:uncharacterized damage-inducible protein DinB